MVAEKIVERAQAIPSNTTQTIEQFRKESLVDAVIGAGKRFGQANRQLIKK